MAAASSRIGQNPDPDAGHVIYPKIVKCIFDALVRGYGNKCETVGKYEKEGHTIQTSYQKLGIAKHNFR